MNQLTLSIITLGVAIIALFLAGYAAVQAGMVRAWRRQFDKSEQPENLEAIITAITNRIKALEKKQTEASKYSRALKEQLGMAVQHVGIERFNSHMDEGGNLSFAVALLDEHHSGMVITSVNGRQHNRIYVKGVTKGKSEVRLSEEENKALQSAIK
jgi:hypothetical protein